MPSRALCTPICEQQAVDIQHRKREEDVPHHQTLFFTDRDLEDSLQARKPSTPVVYLENHENPVKEINAEII